MIRPALDPGPKRTALCYERVGAQVFEAEDLSSAT
jgi:hypothetical protein